ncbi:hypothetical protein FRC12_009163 [Ceratobasidium sp. 428]|nr:hypothetical protein FRC12_009163 [Ceratobasidium sp. 428]
MVDQPLQFQVAPIFVHRFRGRSSDSLARGDDPNVLGGQEFVSSARPRNTHIADVLAHLAVPELYMLRYPPAGPSICSSSTLMKPVDQNGALAALSKNNANSSDARPNNDTNGHNHGMFLISPKAQPTHINPGGFDSESTELDNGPATAAPSRSNTPPCAAFPIPCQDRHCRKWPARQTNPTHAVPANTG